MISRRKAIRSASLAALALPFGSLLSFGKSVSPFTDVPAGDFWDTIRNRYTLSKDSVFFNTGTVGAMPKIVVEKMAEHAHYVAAHVADWAYKDDNKEEFISGYNNLWSIRTKVGRLINANTVEIAITDNVTNGMSYIANGITLQPDDEVLTTDQEHSGGKSSWQVKAKRTGIVFKTVVIPKPAHSTGEIFDDIMNAVTPRTKVLMVSHMISGSGAILPVKELCAEASARGIFTVLDGAQTTGQIAIDVKKIGCDAYVGCFHKWVGAPAGTAFMYIKEDRIKEISTTIASSQWDNHTDDGFRFTQRGTGNFSVLKGLDAALDFYFEVGPDKIYERIKFLGDRLRTGLRLNPKVKIYSPGDEAMCAGITVFNHDGWTGTRLQDEFWTKGKMRPRASGDVFGVRLCTNIFNSPEEVDHAIQIVKDLA